METELLNQITHLVISLVIVLQITPWTMILLGLLAKWYIEKMPHSSGPAAAARKKEGGDYSERDQPERLHRR